MVGEILSLFPMSVVGAALIGMQFAIISNIINKDRFLKSVNPFNIIIYITTF
jgi:hypothetical protein